MYLCKRFSFISSRKQKDLINLLVSKIQMIKKVERKTAHFFIKLFFMDPRGKCYATNKLQ
jgi:hypothetical protein